MTKSFVSLNRRDVILGLAAGSIIPLSGCSTANAPMLLSDADIQRMSDEAWSDAMAQERVLRDPRYQRRLDRVGRRMVDASGQTHLNWEFVVLDNDAVNAWVLPNGKVAFYKGILDEMSNDGHVAAVMGHEMGHVSARHAQQRANQQRTAQIGMQIVNVALQSQGVERSQDISAILGAGVQYGVILPYSRQHEYEADQLGVDYMVASGYQANDAIDLWLAMSALHERSTLDFMSTHPSDDNRIAAMRAHIAARGYA
jgi:predicted Zn-dependent protease